MSATVEKPGHLSEIPLRWVLCWLLLPNLAVVLMWPIIGVPMQAGLAISCTLAIFFSQLPWKQARLAGVALIFLMVTTLYVCHLFSIPPLNFRLIFQFLSDVRPLNAPEYMLAAMLLGLILAAAAYFSPRVPRFTNRTQFLYAVLAAGLFINLDGALASDKRDIQVMPDSSTGFDSAVLQTGLQSIAEKTDRHVIIIVVEALGLPKTKEEKAIFAKTWDRDEWHERYRVSSGASLFFGSTTNGELRELCGVWAHYSEYDFTEGNCLPAHFRENGYDTVAVHNFVGEMFNRSEWYPQIGFDDMLFADDLYRQGADHCPGVFPGACDNDVPSIILKRLSDAGRPQFVYWLTLGTHLPIIADRSLGTDRCAEGTIKWRTDFPDLCRLFLLHRLLADKIGEIAMSKDLPATDILIVGDHKPPIFNRVSSERFDNRHVPWIYLRAKR